MTTWQPALDDDAKPRYLAIADALARDLERGALRPGARLPTHRRLARQLGVTVGTVSRGYAEAERRGLTVGEVGRGTFVRAAERGETFGWAAADSGRRQLIDLSLSLPPELDGDEAGYLAATLRQVADDAELIRLLRYNPRGGDRRQRAAAAAWIARTGLEVEAEQVVVSAGAQHGLTVLFSTLLRPGDLVLTEELTYPGIKSLARLLGLRLRGLALDDQGIVPAAFEQACGAEPRPAALYCVPTIQNPTGAVMSEPRRQAIAAIAEAHDVLIVEDDVHAFLAPAPPLPIAAFARSRTVYLAGVAKCLTPGLRTGFMVAPAALRAQLLAGIRATMWMPAPLMTEITARWLRDGTADAVLAAKREETAARQRLARRLLAGHEVVGHPNAYHLWLRLPEPWRSDEVVALARQRGVLVAGAGAFVVGRQAVPHAVRVSIASTLGRDQLARGLGILTEILADDAASLTAIL